MKGKKKKKHNMLCIYGMGKKVLEGLVIWKHQMTRVVVLSLLTYCLWDVGQIT